MKKLNVLIVDDTAAMRKFIKSGLEDSFPGIHVDEAVSGKTAVIKLEQNEYNLVLCDWELPDLSGDEILQWVRVHPIINHTPFILVSSRRDKGSVTKAIRGGVSSYMVKPFNIGSLVQKVTAVIDHFERRQFQRFAIDGTIDLYFRDQSLKGGVIDLSMGGVFGLSNRGYSLPLIFEKVTVDVNLDSGSILGLDGFVIRLQAAEAVLDSESVKIAVKFSDLTLDRTQDLQRIVSAAKVHEYSLIGNA
jgi:DNA-binding response OmpR family regulator